MNKKQIQEINEYLKEELPYLKIIVILLFLGTLFLVIGLAFASALYCGENETFDSGLYNITAVNFTGNSSNLIYSINNSIIEVTTLDYPCPNNFTMTVYGWDTYNDNKHHSYSGGGGSSVKPNQTTNYNLNVTNSWLNNTKPNISKDNTTVDFPTEENKDYNKQKILLIVLGVIALALFIYFTRSVWKNKQ